MFKRIKFCVLFIVIVIMMNGVVNFDVEAKTGLIAPQDFKYIVGKDDKKIYYKPFYPEKKIDGVVVIFQGLGGGGEEDFYYFSEQLAKNNFQVNIVHQRGTGYSEGIRGDIKDFQIVLDDYKKIIGTLKNHYPEKPLFILGHSLGGTFSIKLADELKDELDGVILLNPTCKLKTEKVSLWTRLDYMFKYLFRPSALTVESKSPDDISHPQDKAEVRKKAEDPLVVQKHSVRYMFEAKKLIDSSLENSIKATSPLFLIYGEKDEFIDHSYSEKIYSKWDSEDKNKHIIKGGGHGAYNGKLIWKDVLKWLQHLTKEI